MAADFIKANRPYWTAKESRERGILIEGHLSLYGPNYLLRTAVAGRALQEKTNYDIEVVFNGFSHQWIVAKSMYQSFGIDGWVYLGNYFLFPNFAFFLTSRILAFWRAATLRDPRDILNITFGSVVVGDLIYDDVIRNTKQKTIDRIDGKVIKAIANSYYYYSQYRRLFEKRKYLYYIATHTAYSEYGLLCRAALLNGVRVIETTDIQIAFFAQISNNRLPTYHEGIKNSLETILKSTSSDLRGLRQEAEESLHQRLDSKVGQLDVLRAYAGRVYAKAELISELGLNNRSKIVFVLAHVFSDAPHLSSRMLHADYYKWLSSTLAVIAKAEGVSWIVKPHPSSHTYGETGMVEEMVREVNKGSVYICPENLNTKSLAMCADAVVTVHGTAGLEFSCAGIPALLAGRPFYSGFGFSMEPDSIVDYDAALLALKEVRPLSESQVNKALEVYGAWNRQFDWANPIITANVLASVWGDAKPRNLQQAYRLLTENLRMTNPRSLKLWATVQNAVS